MKIYCVLLSGVFYQAHAEKCSTSSDCEEGAFCRKKLFKKVPGTGKPNDNDYFEIPRKRLTSFNISYVLYRDCSGLRKINLLY